MDTDLNDYITDFIQSVFKDRGRYTLTFHEFCFEHFLYDSFDFDYYTSYAEKSPIKTFIRLK